MNLNTTCWLLWRPSRLIVGVDSCCKMLWMPSRLIIVVENVVVRVLAQVLMIGSKAKCCCWWLNKWKRWVLWFNDDYVVLMMHMSIVSIEHMHENRVLAQMLLIGCWPKCCWSGVGPNVVDRVLAQMLLYALQAKIHGKVVIRIRMHDARVVWACIHALTYLRCDFLLTVNNVENACWMLMWICTIVLVIN